MKKRVECSVTGRVQFVSFRYSTMRRAKHLGLDGTVENLGNGTVRVIAEGEEDALEKLVTFVKKGPILARVDHADVAFSDATGEFSGFHIVY